MSSPLGPCAAAADLVILLALVAAGWRSRIPEVTRPFIATMALICSWLLAGALDACRAPAWTMYMSGAVIIASVAMTAVTLHLATREPPEEGGGADGPDDPPRDPDDPNAGWSPGWWPEFERELARYAADAGHHPESPLPAGASSRGA